MKNKKAQAGQAITWLYKFFILVIIIGGVIGVVASHYSKQVDVRDMEAAIVAREIIECIAPNGIINNLKIEEINTDTIKSCVSLDEKEIYLNLTLKNHNIIFGDNFLLILCEAEEENINVKYLPACLEERYILLDNQNNEHIIDLFIAIKKINKNL